MVIKTIGVVWSVDLICSKTPTILLTIVLVLSVQLPTPCRGREYSSIIVKYFWPHKALKGSVDILAGPYIALEEPLSYILQMRKK